MTDDPFSPRVGAIVSGPVSGEVVRIEGNWRWVKSERGVVRKCHSRSLTVTGQIPDAVWLGIDKKKKPVRQKKKPPDSPPSLF